MLLQIRVQIPDHPGSLGRVARALGAAGADIVQVAVLERDAGRAVDDFTVSCTNWPIKDRLLEILSVVPGLRVQGVWQTFTVPGASPDVEVLGQIAAEPDRGLSTLVDALPGIFSADWAAVVNVSTPRRTVVNSSWRAPEPLDTTMIRTTREHATSGGDGLHLAAVPLGSTGLLLVVARQDAAPFHPLEMARLRALAGVADTMGVAPDRGGPAGHRLRLFGREG